MTTEWDVATRRWRLRGWTTGEKNPVVDSIVIGDRNLNDALHDLDRDPRINRTAVAFLG